MLVVVVVCLWSASVLAPPYVYPAVYASSSLCLPVLAPPCGHPACLLRFCMQIKAAPDISSLVNTIPIPKVREQGKLLRVRHVVDDFCVRDADLPCKCCNVSQW